MKEEVIKNISLALEQLSKANSAMIDAIKDAAHDSLELVLKGEVLPFVAGKVLIAEDDYGEMMIWDQRMNGIEECMALEDLTANELFDICAEILAENEKN